MEYLRESLTFHHAVIEDWTHRNTEKGLKVHFQMSSNLDKDMAAVLGCEYMLAGDGAPNAATLDAELKETGLVLSVPGSDNGSTVEFFPDVAYKFRASKEDTRIKVQCRVHVSSRLPELHELLKDLKGAVDITLRPRQGELFEGGTRVDMSPADDDDREPGSAEANGPLFEAATAVEQTTAANGQAGGMWPLPDDNGVYDETHAHIEKYQQKWADVSIRVLEVVRGWIRAETCRIRGIGYHNDLTLESPAHATRQDAIVAGCNALIAYCYP